MAVSYSLAMQDDDHCFDPFMQNQLVNILKLTKSLKGKTDQTDGLASKMAEEGVRSTAGVSIATKNLLFVVDHGFFELDDGMDYGKYIEFLLNGQYFRLTCGHGPMVNNDHATGFPPQGIKAVKQPSRLATLVPKTVPAPINAVTGGDPGRKPNDVLVSRRSIESDAPASDEYCRV